MTSKGSFHTVSHAGIPFHGAIEDSCIRRNDSLQVGNDIIAPIAIPINKSSITNSCPLGSVFFSGLFR
ncbi:MAG: hypothetical protein NT007_16280 [Candidatus Kapabacteria bacterium]|nr:hypothetical protein [Candidatus Kapabacteria bacterium]